MTNSDDPSLVSFGIKYDGPGLRDGRMSASDAGLAIMAAGRLVERASDRALAGGGQVSLEVDANFRSGSFDIHLTAVAWVGEVISTVSIEDLSNIVKMLFGGGGLLALFKLLRGRQPESVEIDEQGGVVQLTVGGENNDVSIDVYNLFLDVETRSAARDLVRPVESAGVDKMVVLPPGDSPLEIWRDEVDWFDLEPSQREIVSELESTRIVGIVSIVYKEDNKWRFTEGDTEYTAVIEDEMFWRRIHSGETLPEGTALRVDMVTRTIVRPDAISTERRITRVREIIREGQVRQLDLMDDDT